MSEVGADPESSDFLSRFSWLFSGMFVAAFSEQLSHFKTMSS